MVTSRVAITFEPNVPVAGQVLILSSKGTGHLWRGNWLISLDLIFHSWCPVPFPNC
jgi:hypothetical protein